MKSFLLTALTVASLNANAVLFTEVSDVGELLGSAHALSAGTDRIVGVIDLHYADLYQFG